ncbi:hypothetical protein PGT21_028840 [Puccinia graminis f. sp. tritici]|uniref:Uncharacterized protein n=1 Tax=Puccinia graminis f. sp. tritici TaxID=56615 RepID=A0A5B0M5M9_PUCGR|nr:hypothetical protein PGT21_028840 [Puccinia graminis f. sp. tritici]
MPCFNNHTPGPRASNLYPLSSQMSLPEPSILYRGLSRVFLSPNSERAANCAAFGQSAGFPIEINSQGSAPLQLADPRTISRPVSPKATRAARAQRLPPALVGLHPQDQGGASPPYQHCPTPLLDPNTPFQPQATPKWCRLASSNQGSSSLPVARCPFELASSLLNHLSSLLSSNRAVIDKPWTLLPALRPQNLSTPSDVCSSVNVAPSTLTSASQEESEVPDEDDLESSSSQYTASSNQSYPFACQPRVASPNPPGFYDMDEFHLLRDHQIDSLLSCQADPAWL